ncbi:MAG: UvrD-helicase domain-containing protein [Deltaproteobacteria bacterium]|nr:UvrD-helicase domain-containing protein [Deltaproteobacteria bacterium]
MVDAVRTRIFPKRESSTSCEENTCNSVCQGLGKCYIAEKSEKQLAYVLSSASTNLFLKACPGSGKTEVVGLKAAYEFHAWKQKHCGIAILTFTNNATDVIRKRVYQYAGIERSAYPHFIGTLDSWLHGYLAHPFGASITGYVGQKNDRSIRLVEDHASGGWLFNYQYLPRYWHSSQKNNPPRSMPLYANMLRFDVETNQWEIKRPVTGSSEYLIDQDYFDSDAFQTYKSDKPLLTLARMRKDFLDTKEPFCTTASLHIVILNGFVTDCSKRNVALLRDYRSAFR